MSEPRVVQAQREVLHHEGRWAFDPDDPGGRTWRGVTQRDWDWLMMWPILGKCMRNGKPDLTLLTKEEVAQINEDVAFVFRSGYWARARAMELFNYSIAVQLVDCCYHTGKHRAVTFMQRGLNVCNNVGKLYPDITVDGGVGRIQTIPALKACIDVGRGDELHFLFQSYRAEFYTELMEKSPKREKYFGWFPRARSWIYSPDPI